LYKWYDKKEQNHCNAKPWSVRGSGKHRELEKRRATNRNLTAKTGFSVETAVVRVNIYIRLLLSEREG
jgi:hypothetical protein